MVRRLTPDSRGWLRDLARVVTRTTPLWQERTLFGALVWAHNLGRNDERAKSRRPRKTRRSK